MTHLPVKSAIVFVEGAAIVSSSYARRCASCVVVASWLVDGGEVVVGGVKKAKVTFTLANLKMRVDLMRRNNNHRRPTKVNIGSQR